MFIKKLEYENYRNLEKGIFIPHKEINVIYGNNAQGKTNLIEAIWLFCGKKSFRSAKDSQLVKIHEETENLKAELKLEFYSQGRYQDAEIIIENKRNTRLNGIEQKNSAAISECFPAILFSPADMDLIKEGPSQRRKFIDNAISSLRPKYEKMLSAYNKAVLQRNNILYDALFHSELTGVLEAFEDRIATAGAYIISQRKKYIEALMSYAPDIYRGISGDTEDIGIEYKCGCGEGSYEELLDALRLNRAEDTKTSTTGVGPHRDDIDFSINGLSAKIYGSQGQKRSCVLALKLSEAELLKKYTGEQPIAILDDVMSELDRVRQDYILNHIRGWQVFITCCESDTVKYMEHGGKFRMHAGVLSED